MGERDSIDKTNITPNKYRILQKHHSTLSFARMVPDRYMDALYCSFPVAPIPPLIPCFALIRDMHPSGYYGMESGWNRKREFGKLADKYLDAAKSA